MALKSHLNLSLNLPQHYLYLRDGETWRAGATTRDAPLGYVEARKRNLLQLSPGDLLKQVIDTKQVVPTIVAAVELGGFRTCLMVPMLRCFCS